MKVAKKRHVGPPRTTAEEAQQIVGRIPILTKMFRNAERPSSADMQAIANAERKEREELASSVGLLFACRFTGTDMKPKGTLDSNKDGSRDGSERLESDSQNSTFRNDITDNLLGANNKSGENDRKRDFIPASLLSDALGAIEKPSSSGGGSLGGSLKKKQRFAMSLATLSMRPEKRKSLVADGALAALIDLSAINDLTIQKSCASSFSHLAKEPSIRRSMHDAGVIGVLLVLSSSNSRLVKMDCARAICNLYCESGYEAKALRDNVPLLLVRIVQECPDAYEIILTCVLNLSCISDKITRVEEIHEVLLQLHSISAALSEKQQLIVLQTLCNLSAIRSNQLKLVEDGCLRIVEKAVKSENSELRCLATDIVRNLTTCSRTRPKLLDHNIISVLVSMSKDTIEDVKRGAVWAFYYLSRDQTCREKIVSGNAVSVIIKISQEKISSVDMGRMAARTLRVLCGDSQISHRLVSDGIVKALMALLRTDDGAIQQYCAESICSLFQVKDVLSPLIQQGAVSVIVSLSQQATDLVTGEWCSFALYHLATNKACPNQTLTHGVLPCLIKLCDISSPRTKYFCTAAFAYITMLKNVNASGAIPILVHMLREESDVNTKNNCAASLYNLADHDENCFLMMEAGALLPVVHLTQSDNLQTKIKCAAILCRLSLQKQYYSQFAGEDVLQMLLALSDVEHTLTQRRVIISLSNLSQNKDLRRQLLGLDPFPYIIALAAKRDENLRRGCVSIVCNLACEAGNEKLLVQAKVVPTLLITAMISSDQIETKTICVKALINLMADRSLYKAMVNDGVIWGFSSLAQLGDPLLVQLCAQALCSLSCEFAEEMLPSAATIKTIIMLINRVDDLELQRAGGRTLTNLLVCTTNDHADLRQYVVQNLTPLAACKDEEVSEMTILCLCIISMSESCRERIVNSGMLRMIDASTIFASQSLSYAYLTMFGNIANNPTMRTQVLDDRSVSRFEQICKAGDASLDLAVMKAIYCISCAPENIPKIAQQNLLPVIETINSAKYAKSSEMMLYIIVTLFNMTTVADVQAQLVSQGLVALLVQFWPQAKKDPKMALYLIQSLLHLANGPVNTTKMVNDGVTPILVFLAERKHPTEYNIPYHMYHHCAAAFRNLLCAQGNQEVMFQAGCIEALVNIAQRAASARHSMEPLSPLIKTNCASALRSMTYSETTRDVLKKSAAIDIMLDDDNNKINYSLLVELEAESWANGARGAQREGRARPIAPCPLTTSYLKSNLEVMVDVDEKRYADLEKFHVQVQLDEPDLELEDHVSELSVGIEDLTKGGETEESSAGPKTGSCPKQEVELSAVPIQILKNVEVEEISPMDAEFDALDLDSDSRLGGGNSTSLPLLKPASSGPEINSNRKSMVSHAMEDLPGLGRKDAVGSSSAGLLGSSLDSQGRKRRQMHKPVNPDETFATLVSFIKASKQAKGALIGDVVDRWTKISRF